MSWTQRLRDIVLAGGAVATAGCTNGQASTVPPSPEAGTLSDAGAPGNKDAADDAGPVPDDSGIETNFCCNADPDPCCAFEHCDASLGTACECSLDGGSFDYGTQSCSLPNGDADAHD